VVAFTDEIDSWMHSQYALGSADSKSEIDLLRGEVKRLLAEIQMLREELS
jgi:hypothetical protein